MGGRAWGGRGGGSGKAGKTRRENKINSHMGELVGDYEPVRADEGLACCANSLLAVGCEGNVGTARVPAAE